MWTIIMILLISCLVVIVEVPFMKKKAWKKELFVFYILLLFGTGLSIAEAVDADIPNPLDWISLVYKPFSDLIYGMVE
jgi:hypothetical protein